MVRIARGLISRRLLLWVIGGFAGLAILAAAALVIAAVAIDPERYKPRIQAEFERRTGRPLVLEGALSWRFFPWIVIRSGGGSIGNPPEAGFASPDFVKWRTLRLGVQLLPLFDGQVIVDSVEIDGLELGLERLADGVDNWHLLRDEGDAAAAAPGQPRDLQFAVDEIRLEDARIGWRDATLGQDWGTENLSVRLRIPGRASLQRVELRDIRIKGRLGGTPLPNIVDVAFEAQRLDYDGDPLRVRLPGWSAAFAGAAMEGAVDAVLGGADRRIDGRIAARVESLREVLRAVGIELPRTRDREVFGTCELIAEFELDRNRVATDSLQIRLDDTRFRGRAERAPLRDGRLMFALVGDAIDFDRYLEPDNVRGDPFELPLGPLRALKAEGEVAMTEATAGGVVLRGVRVNVE